MHRLRLLLKTDVGSPPENFRREVLFVVILTANCILKGRGKIRYTVFNFRKTVTERKTLMIAYGKMTAEERKVEYAALQKMFDELKARGLNLNMARGKPGKAQLDLVSDIFALMQKPEDYVSDGIDVRNYGELSGIPAAKRLFADILGCRDSQVFDVFVCLSSPTISIFVFPSWLVNGTRWLSRSEEHTSELQSR